MSPACAVAGRAPGGARRLLARVVAAAQWAFDSPSAEHDARTILSSPKVGLWLGVEQLALLGGTAGGVAFLSELGHVDAFRGSDSGLLGTELEFLSLALFLTCIVPLRSSGLIEGPRWRGYFDQVVTTGISPLRYFAGKWATSQIFFLTLLAASLPLVLLSGLLFGASWPRVAVSYFLLYAYCNLLLLTSSGLAVAFHEVVALILCWFGFGFSFFLGLVPAPGTLSLLSPARYLVRPLAEAATGPGTVDHAFYASLRPFGLDLPWELFALAAWGVLGAVAVGACALGPLHAPSPGLNNFGALVLRGDRKRLFFRRHRPLLLRRVELSFLFENAGPGLRRWQLPLRALLQVALVGLFACLFLGACFDLTSIEQTGREVVLAFHGVACSLVVLATWAVFAPSRLQALCSFRLGRLRVPAGAFDAAGVLCVLALVVVLHTVGFSAGRDALVGTTSWWERLGPEEACLRATSNLGVFCAFALWGLLVLQSLGARWRARWQVLGATVLLAGALAIVPALLEEAVREAATGDAPLDALLASPLLVFAEASPLVQTQVDAVGVPGLELDTWLVRKGFWFWQGLFLWLLGPEVFFLHRSLAREAAWLRGERSPSPSDPACASCGGRRWVPAGRTSWSGVLFSVLFGVRRCVDCGAFGARGRGRVERRWRVALGAANFALGLGLLGALFVYVAVRA
ncbi:MAG: hypothetical protein D6731_22435 [Planctomycetota bacterium]|nr:MAG: hypothetical protein D6731_22435 [Planctomycetota bacterium]